MNCPRPGRQDAAERALRAAYSLAHYVGVPLLLARLAWRARGNPAYWRRWGERFAVGGEYPSSPGAAWVHAVSVGEVQAALPLVEALARRCPDAPILVTTTTPTGSDRVRAALGMRVVHRYFPYDLPDAVARFLAHVRPRVAVLMETELWPNTIAACARAGVPLVLANARLSQRSADGYRRVAPLARGMLARLDVIAAQGADDARRLVELGAPRERVEVTGSIKFDLRLAASLREESEALRRIFGVDRDVWIAASTHEGEEELVLDAFAAVRERSPNCLLVLVPRHPERFSAALAAVRRRGLRVARRSERPSECSGCDVFLGDSMGELPLFYGAADVAFVGGSLVPIGGHNPLEPAALGLPVLSGPHLFNFADIYQRLGEEQAAHVVDTPLALATVLGEWLADANRRHAVGERGRAVVERNRGALDRMLSIIEPLL